MATTLVKARCLQRKLYSRSQSKDRRRTDGQEIVAKGKAGIWHKTPGGNLQPVATKSM
jgi:hypothetical protein